jgi:hypothetical protein
MEHKLNPRRAPQALQVGRISRLLPFVIALCMGIFALYQLNPPAAVPADAPPTEFSSGRALQQLQSIAREPHPLGSIEDANVRQYIVGQLSGLGLSPEIQRAVITRRMISDRLGPRAAANIPDGQTVNNIVARISGTGSTKAILLVAHYDSVPVGPGASDDGAAVAALLETARALRASPALRNDVILLFTDGEEAGLLGSIGFVEESSLVDQIGLALNFEARGTSGPALMFETSDQNGWLITEFAKVAPHPIANSLMFNIYQILPNNTDFSMLKGAGLAGFNFAFIGNSENYHSPNDSLSAISEPSLEHHGANALALTRHFGDLDLRAVRSSNLIYFDIMGLAFVYYPIGWVLPLAVLTALVYIVVVVVGVRRKQLTLVGIGVGVLAFLGSIIVAVALVMGLWLLIQTVAARTPALPTNSLVFAIFAVLTIIVVAALYALLSRRRAIAELSAGALLWWLLLAILTSVYLPGGSYLFTLPLLFSLIGLGLNVAGGSAAFTTRAAIIVVLCAIPGLALFVPTIALIFMTLTLRLAWALALLMVLMLGLLIPQLCLLSAPGSARAASASLPGDQLP